MADRQRSSLESNWIYLFIKEEEIVRIGVGLWVLVLFGAGISYAQPIPVPQPSRFDPMVEFRFNCAAGSSMNLPSGDETVISGLIRFDGEHVWQGSRLMGKVYGSLALGVEYRNEEDSEESFKVRENDIFVEGLLLLPLHWRIDPYLSTSIRSVITESFLYFDAERKQIASFLDPMTLLSAAGASYGFVKGENHGSGRVGVALQQIRARSNTDKTDDAESEGVIEQVKTLSGIELCGDARLMIDSNAFYQGKLDLFGSFNDLSVWTLQSENEVIVTCGDLLTFSWGITIRHDISETRRTQFSSAMSIGVIARL